MDRYVTSELLTNELNKLSKKVIVEILVSKEVSSDLSDVVRHYFQTLFQSSGENSNAKCESEVNSNLSQGSEVKDTDSDFFDALSSVSNTDNMVDIRIFKYIIRQKDFIITELKDRINSLQQLMHSGLSDQGHGLSSKTKTIVQRSDECILDKNSDLPATSSDNVQPDASLGSKLTDSTTQLNVSKVSAHVSMQSASISNCNNDTKLPAESVSTNGKGLWSQVVKSNRKRVTVVGKSEKSDAPKLQGVPKITSLHVYRLPPSTKAENIINLLKPSFPEAKCEQLQSRHPEVYSSFKVDIFEDNLDSALNPNMWPNNVCVRRFFLPRVKPPVG